MKLHLSIESEGDSKSIQELKDEFYTMVKRRRYEDWRSLQLNPLPTGFTAWDQFKIDFYIALYYRGYYVRIEKGNLLHGPHKCQLQFQVDKGQHVLLGTHLGKFMFYDEAAIFKKLRVYSKLEKYFCSEVTAKTVIQLPPSDPTERIAL